MNFREYVKNHRVLTDGAMGTYIDAIEEANYLCSEELNVVNPDLVRQVHREYIESGASLIFSNTFQANRRVLKQLKEKDPEHFAKVSLQDLIGTAFSLAKEMAEKADHPVFVAGDISPLPFDNEREQKDMLGEYYEICDCFLKAGAEIFVFETFPDEKDLLKLAEYVRSKKPDAYLIGQFTFAPTGYSVSGFHFKSVLHRAAYSGLLDAVGFNCGVGAAHLQKFIESYLKEDSLPEQVALTALPNCGYPKIVRGRAVYSDGFDYFKDKMEQVLSLGVRIVGGCCGTTPEYIKGIHELLEKEELVRQFPTRPIPIKDRAEHPLVREVVAATGVDTGKTEEAGNSFRRKLEAGEMVYAVELDPPFDASIEKIMAGAKALVGTKADIVTVADSPLARSRADSILMSAKLKRESGMDIMPHVACRDRNRIAMRSSILGAYVNDIRNMLFVTGDPVGREERGFTKSVFDFNSIKLMQFVQSMNEENFKKEPMFYGGALNQNGVNLDAIANRMLKKMEAGCSYFLTQPVYSEQGLETLAYLKEKTGARILIGIMPLVSRRNALFIQNEMPGILVPDEVLNQYRENASRQEWEEVAISVSKHVMELGKEIGAGYYMMTPFNRVSLIKQILE